MTDITDTPVFFLTHAGAELYGADRVFLESARALAATDARVVTVLPCDGPLVSLLNDAGSEVFISPSPVLRKSMLSPLGLVRLTGSFITGAARGVRLLRKIRPETIYVNTVTTPLWPFLGKLLRIPVLVHVHEAERTAPKLLRTALAFPLIFADSIVCNSSYSAGALHEVIPRLAPRTKVVYNGLPGPETVIRAREIAHPPLRVLYVGRLSERKGVHTLIEAMSQLQATGLDARLDVVGAVFPGNEEYLASLERQVAAASLSDVVQFRGFDPQVWDWFASCDVAAVPSAVDEPFGDTAVEAVLAARPVIASRTPGLTEAAGDYDCVQLVESGNAAALAQAIQNVHEQWPDFSAAAFTDSAAAALKHSPELYGQRIYDELLALLPAPTAVTR